MRFGLVGTGHWARSTHAPAIADHLKHELVGVWGRSEKRRREFASEFEITAFDSFEELLGAVDSIAFATEPEQQTELAPQAVNASKHLILDKPAALTSQKASALAQASEDRGLTVKVFHTARYRPEIERWIQNAMTGTWDSGTGRWLAAALSDSSSPYFNSEWRKTWGPVWDAGPHAMSILLPIFGSIKAVSGTHWDGPTLRTQIVFDSAAVSVDLSVAEPSKVSRIELTLEGSSGKTQMPDFTTPAHEAYGLLLDRFTGNGDVSDLRLGAEVVAALELIEASAPSTFSPVGSSDVNYDTTGRR